MQHCSSNILIPSLLKVDVTTKRALTKMRADPRDSGCACAGARGPSGASSFALAAHRRSSSPSAAATRPQSTDAPRHFLISPERSRKKRKRLRRTKGAADSEKKKGQQVNRPNEKVK